MPIYTYQCQQCGTTFDELIFSAEREKGLSCPKCKATSLERRMTAFAAVSKSAPECGAGACSSCRYES
ncbi:MAG: zinc ribbon domain-containing protein [Candidatus Zixiibacteriota bacterium]